MGFKEELISEIKFNKEELNRLPKGFQRIGDIIIISLTEFSDKRKSEIGEAIIKIFPYIKTVCSKEGPITGEFREPQVKVISGSENTVVTHIESGIKYKFDVAKIMFAKGNIVERVRIPKQVKDNEIIVDMFAGIGYFSLPIGKLSNPKKVHSIELNPVSFKFLSENIKLNKIENKFKAINGDCREVVDKLINEGVKADRVLMGYLPPPKEYLPWAFRIIKKGGTLHYEDLVNITDERNEVEKIVNEVKKIAKSNGRDIELIFDRKIKSYGPKIGHWVFDLKVI